MISQAKIAHYSSLVEESSGIRKISLTLLKSCFINQKLSASICTLQSGPRKCIFKLFCYKIENIRRSFPPVSAILSQTQPHKDPHCRLSVFEPTCVTEIKKLIMKSPSNRVNLIQYKFANETKYGSLPSISQLLETYLFPLVVSLTARRLLMLNHS